MSTHNLNPLETMKLVHIAVNKNRRVQAENTPLIRRVLQQQITNALREYLVSCGAQSSQPSPAHSPPSLASPSGDSRPCNGPTISVGPVPSLSRSVSLSTTAVPAEADADSKSGRDSKHGFDDSEPNIGGHGHLKRSRSVSTATIVLSSPTKTASAAARSLEKATAKSRARDDSKGRAANRQPSVPSMVAAASMAGSYSASVVTAAPLMRALDAWFAIPSMSVSSMPSIIAVPGAPFSLERSVSCA